MKVQEPTCRTCCHVELPMAMDPVQNVGYCFKKHFTVQNLDELAHSNCEDYKKRRK